MEPQADLLTIIRNWCKNFYYKDFNVKLNSKKPLNK